jgi:hypothetical protein
MSRAPTALYGVHDVERQIGLVEYAQQQICVHGDVEAGRAVHEAVRVSGAGIVEILSTRRTSAC